MINVKYDNPSLPFIRYLADARAGLEPAPTFIHPTLFDLVELLLIQPVIRRFFGYDDVVDVAFF